MCLHSKHRTLVLLIILNVFVGEISSLQNRKKRIVNGNRVSKGDAPFVVSLQIAENSNFVHFCTGSYVGEGLILTASHCLKHM